MKCDSAFTANHFSRNRKSTPATCAAIDAVKGAREPQAATASNWHAGSLDADGFVGASQAAFTIMGE